MSTIHEECGVFGVFSAATRDVASTVYYGLYALIHINIVCLGISVILAVAVYAAAYLILSKPTQEDILMIPGGTHLLRLASKLHLM